MTAQFALRHIWKRLGLLPRPLFLCELLAAVWAMASGVF